MQHITYDTKGICAVKIDFDIEEGKVYNLKFHNGCDGNHKRIGKFGRGYASRRSSKRLRGVTCGPRTSSCPDQLAQALEQYLKKKKNEEDFFMKGKTYYKRFRKLVLWVLIASNYLLLE